ncbi:MAG: bifunctional demethylmenaquinone methyltransferase/2-methoxy-6-polyprenyl-1,4-benzoquinol methylase UbiE [Prevotellaceae bacterium]|jgi:demethylmenaquinone methyltransferase/2-methoxy-6-polyprenyl-1,4-benzoquinol methylase|nr:bifunctional demethylmenaquinone methyltransferase/2-methoxy-6-polyprenyl-1,4-benzoquinol methylase UbiE [Prevotellaceae bacterium]
MSVEKNLVTPYGTDGSKAEQIERMFDRIAPMYDRLNHTLSWGIDRYWRRQAIAKLRPYSPKRVLDVATGTGDFALLAYRMLRPVEMYATDVSEGMMQVGREKARRAGCDRLRFSREDCLSFSFPDNSFDAATVAFGVRNLENPDTGLREIWRVLCPGGHLVILELSTPVKWPMKQLYNLYSRWFIPRIGRLFSRDAHAYHYLPESIRAFPQGEAFCGKIRQAGFVKVSFRRFTFGICTLYTAAKPLINQIDQS